MQTLIVFDEKVIIIIIIAYFWMFSLIIEKRLICVATKLPYNGKIK